jgi:hypothetical protein
MERGQRGGTKAAFVFENELGKQNRSSTTVPLTLQVLKPTMPLHDIPGGSGAGEGPAKSSTGGTCTFTEQTRLVSCLTLV